ncbi:MAG: lysylphosphatidylglycerol synthase transmembrane domain-containing protein [Candidatus Hodarchaeota archaeon]
MNWKFWLGILISVLFLFLAFRKVNITEFKQALQGANYIYLIPVVLLALSSFAIRALRWRYLLEPIKKIRFHSLFSATMIGFMANNLLPARLGEFVRAYIIGEKERISKSSSFATIVIERIFDGFTLLFFLALILIFFSSPEWLKNSGYIAFIIFFTTLIFLILLKNYTKKTLRLVSFVFKPFPHGFQEKLINFLNSFIDGLKILHNTKNVIKACIFSLFIWLPSVLLTYLLFISFNMNLPVYAAFLLLSAITISIMIPAAPGFIGTVQYVCVLTLSLFAISNERALSFSIIYHASLFIPVTTVGLVYSVAEGLSFKKIRDSIKPKKEYNNENRG